MELKKKEKGIQIKLNPELLVALESYQKKTGSTKTWVILKALENFLKSNSKG